MKISAVIATYNCASYLGDAIQSVLDQTYPVTELIVVDDGSTDDTQAVVDRFGSRVTFVRTPNQGAAAARNVGLSRCSGDAVAFLDADDAWYPDKLAWQADVLERHADVAAVCTDFGLVTVDLRRLRDRYVRDKYRVFRSYGLSWADVLPDGEVRQIAGVQAQVRVGDAFATLFRGNFVNTSSVVVRRSAMSPFATGRITQEDYDLWLKVSMRGKFAFVDLPLLLFRARPGQLTSDDNRFQVVKDTAEVVESYLSIAGSQVEPAVLRHRFEDVSCNLAIAYLGRHRAADARAVLRHARNYCGWTTRMVVLAAWSWIPPGAAATGVKFLRRVVPR